MFIMSVCLLPLSPVTLEPNEKLMKFYYFIVLQLNNVQYTPDYQCAGYSLYRLHLHFLSPTSLKFIFCTYLLKVCRSNHCHMCRDLWINGLSFRTLSCVPTSLSHEHSSHHKTSCWVKGKVTTTMSPSSDTTLCY